MLINKNVVGGINRGNSITPVGNAKKIEKGKKSVDNNVKIVGCNIDTIYINFEVDLDKKVINKMKEVKKVLTGDEVELFNLCGNYELNLKSYGANGYNLLLENNLFRVAIATSDKINYPAVRVNIGSEILWTKGIKSVVNDIYGVLGALGTVKGEQISRLDLCCDFLSDYFAKNSIYEEVISRARTISNYIPKEDEVSFPEIRVTQKNRKFNAWCFGSKKSDVYCRIYNKSLEIRDKKNKKDWFYKIWGLDPKVAPDVWRCEFEVNRTFLKNCSINTLGDLEDKLNKIWEYLTTQWLRFAYNDDEKTYRRTVIDIWEEIQNIKFDIFDVEEDTGELIRKTAKKADIRILIDMVKGCLTSIGAITRRMKLEDIFLDVSNRIRREFGDDEFLNDVLLKIPKYQH